jgi:hypothetical protein
MPLKYFKTFNTGPISGGNYVEIRWVPDEDIQIDSILLTDRSGGSLNAVTAYIAVDSDVWTRDYVNAVVFTHDYQTIFPVNRSVRKGQTIYIKLTNNGTTTVNVDVIFYIIA